MSTSHCILESSFSCEPGVPMNIWDVAGFLALHVNTNLLQHFFIASLCIFYLCPVYISSHLQSQTACFCEYTT